MVYLHLSDLENALHLIEYVPPYVQFRSLRNTIPISGIYYK
jgi:hypothetical protein